jgi:hypothetical protein
MLMLDQISNETDKVYTFLRGLLRFTAGSVRMHKPNTLQEYAVRTIKYVKGTVKYASRQKPSGQSDCRSVHCFIHHPQHGPCASLR